MKVLKSLNTYLNRLISVKGETVSTAQARLKIVRSLTVIMMALLIIRLFDVSLIQVSYESVPPQNISLAEKITSRADIIDRNGVLLASSLPVSSLYADPKLIENKNYIAQRLESILKIDDVAQKLDKNTRFVWIKRGITPEEHYHINALGSPGLAFRRETRRFYPQGRQAAHILGYTSLDGEGLAGLELHYNDQLRRGGEPLKLAMDIRLQHALRKNLKNVMERFSAVGATGGIIDIQNGDVLAAVSLPDFDPHHANKAKATARFNRFALGVYEMGSTFKIFSTANYIETNNNPFAASFDATEPLKQGRFTIRDFHAEKRILTLPEVFIHSSNIGSALMGQTIGTKTMKDFYADLGLTQKVSADFPALSRPLIPSPWRDINTLTASYGHGIAVSPLHVLQATAAVANGGRMMPLRFALHHNDTDDKIERRILSASTAHKMRQLLRLNVTHGSGAQADIQGYHIGGKTGTSEKVSAQGGYDSDKLLSSFISVFPAHDPRYAVLVILDEPKGTSETHGYATGGWTAAPAAGQIIADMVRILGLAPDTQNQNLTAGLDRYLKQNEPLFNPASFSY
jgi:cell division protein FtsI (penicillin-binding protein 3)